MSTRGLRLPPHLRAVPDAPADEPSADTRRGGAPARPTGLPKAVSDAWDAIVPELDRAGLVSPADGPTIELALRHYVVALKASRTLARGPVVVDDGAHDRLAKHPASQVFRDHSLAFLDYARQLGMTFAARTRLPAPPARDDAEPNPFAGPTLEQP